FNTWVYMPFSKDGESEFIKAGSLLWAGIEYSNWHPDEIDRRDKGLTVGRTSDLPYHDARSLSAYPRYNGQTEAMGWSFMETKNLMIRLYLHEHSNSTNPDISEGNTFALGQNYPNPFTDQTVINYTLGRDETVKLEITNLTGQVVFSTDEGIQPVGQHQIQIQSPGLSPGIYFYTLHAGQDKQTRKMIVMEN
ncbi:MAG: T9SS type A sorting domain-containing protein, partial [Bacteroidota bacterium]